MKSIIHSSLTIKALSAANVPLGGALIINQGGDNDGTMNIDSEAEDFSKVIAILVGAVLEMQALKTMVIPSNIGKLSRIRDFLANELDVEADYDQIDFIESLIEDIESIQFNLKYDN